jgi:hypothetical protein
MEGSAGARGSRRLMPTRKLPGRALKGETVIVDSRARRVFVMNPVAGAVWAGVERGASAAEIVTEIVKRFRVDEARASTDVERFLDELEAAGLAQPVEGRV